MNVMKLIALSVLLLASGLSTGCATLSKGDSRLVVESPPGEIAAYEGGKELSRCGDRTTYRDGSVVLVSRCFWVGDASTPHTVTLYSEDREVQVKTSSSIGTEWLIKDLATGGTGFVVDGLTGKWKEFDPVDVRNVFELARPLIFSAIEANDQERIRQILEASETALRRTDSGRTPVHRAVLMGNAEMLQLLLNFNPDLSALDDQQKTPLQLALDLEQKTPGKFSSMVQLLKQKAAAPPATPVPETRQEADAAQPAN